MDILILGNGFDLAHDLETKYNDFLIYCIKKYSIDTERGKIKKNCSFSNNIWLRHFIINKPYDDKWINLEKEIYIVINNIDKNLSHSTRKYTCHEFLKKFSFYANSIDINFDLNKIISQLKAVDREYNEVKSEKGYIYINENNSNYKEYCFYTYDGFINFMYDQLREFIKAFNNYLISEVLPHIGDKKYNFQISNNKKIRVLNFNYTDTYEKLYGTNSINAEEKPKYIYIHGKFCDSEDCNLIFGTHSFFNKLPNDLNEEICVDFNIFKKHNQRHRYGTIEAYQELLNEIKNERKNVKINFHIIGHSLDIADHNILRHVFKAKENSRINIYYHNQEALERLINNITDIIGEEKVMTKVRFIKQNDAKQGILIPQ